MCASPSNRGPDKSVQIWPPTGETVTWPPPQSMNDEDLEAFARGDHLRFTDADGNEVKVSPVYPGHETSWGFDGSHSYLVWEDHKEELKWSRVKRRYRRTFWNWLKGPRYGRR